MGVFSAALKLRKLASPATPPAGVLAIYPKEDGLLYIKDENGAERPLIPKPDQLHTNPSFDTTVDSTSGNQNEPEVASRPVPAGGWEWGWNYPIDTALTYPTVTVDSTMNSDGVGKSLKVSYGGAGTTTQYVWSSAWAIPAGSLVNVTARIRTSAVHMAATVGLLSAASSNPSPFVSGWQIQGTSQVTSVGAWTKITGSFILPAGHTHGRLVLQFRNDHNGATPAAGDVWADDTESSMTTVPQAQVIPGTIQMWPTASAPEGYLLCDGSEKAVADYPSLDALLGTTFGARTNGSGGEGSTHFRLPDFRGRSPLGVGTASPAVPGGTAHTLGQKGGEEKHTQTVGELASHNHHYFTGYAEGVGTADWGFANGSGRNFKIAGEWDSNNTGSNTPFNVLDPYLGINFIIKT